jgi:hypothetical protein
MSDPKVGETNNITKVQVVVFPFGAVNPVYNLIFFYAADGVLNFDSS